MNGRELERAINYGHLELFSMGELKEPKRVMNR